MPLRSIEEVLRHYFSCFLALKCTNSGTFIKCHRDTFFQLDVTVPLNIYNVNKSMYKKKVFYELLLLYAIQKNIFFSLILMLTGKNLPILQKYAMNIGKSWKIVPKRYFAYNKNENIFLPHSLRPILLKSIKTRKRYRMG